MKRILAITLCFTFIGIGSAFAQSEAQDTKAPDQSVAAPVAVDQQRQRHFFEFGTEIWLFWVCCT
jgi:hypothetical protein